MNNRFSRITHFLKEGYCTWAVGTIHGVLARGRAASWKEAQQAVRAAQAALGRE